MSCQQNPKANLSLSDLASNTAGRAAVDKDPRYMTFSRQEEAFAWAKTLEARMASKTGKAPRAILPKEDQSYVKANQVVADVWSGYKQLYPNIIGSLDAPYVIILQDPEANAFAVYDPSLGKIPIAFFIQTGALATASGKPLTDTQLYGLIAHELAHLVLAHVYPGARESRAIHFRILPGREQLGFMQVDQPEIKKMVDDWNELAHSSGEFPYAELNGLSALISVYGNLCSSAVAKRIATPLAPSVCAHLATSTDNLRSFKRSTLNQIDQTWPLDADGKVKLNDLSSAVVRDGKACFDGGPTFSQSLRDVLGTDAGVNAIMVDPDLAREKDNNTFVAINNLTKTTYTKMAMAYSQSRIMHPATASIM